MQMSAVQFTTQIYRVGRQTDSCDFQMRPIAWIGRGPVTISTFEPKPEHAVEILMFRSMA